MHIQECMVMGMLLMNMEVTRTMGMVITITPFRSRLPMNGREMTIHLLNIFY